jgi:hypothetical protein
VPKLLEILSLKDTIVTMDAMNCQRDIARQIVDQGGDYALARKDNQKTLRADVRSFLNDSRWRERSMEITVASRPAPPWCQLISSGFTLQQSYLADHLPMKSRPKSHETDLRNKAGPVTFRQQVTATGASGLLAAMD